MVKVSSGRSFRDLDYIDRDLEAFAMRDARNERGRVGASALPGSAANRGGQITAGARLEVADGARTRSAR